MALQKWKRGKRPRQDSSGGLCIEEMSPDDMGYDGDIEVLRPDQYEEPESDFEDDKALQQLWPDTDDELAKKLRRLSCDPHVVASSRRDDGDRGRKRMSKEMDTEHPGPRGKQTEIEVSEVVDGHMEQHPPKRRKKRASKQPLSHRMGRKPEQKWSDSSDQTEHPEAIESSHSGTPDATSTPAVDEADEERDGDGEAMDIG